jgi:putative intracellular protease/amidase
MIDWWRARGDRLEIVMSVCTGSALLAEAARLMVSATSNKLYLQIAVDVGPKVH